LAGGSSLGEAVVATCSADEEDGMFIVGPLWLILLILLFTRPVRAFKLLFGFLFGAVIGLGFWMVVIAAYGSALAETLACSTTFQDYRVCQGPSGYRSTETPVAGHDHWPGQPGRTLVDQPLAGLRHHHCRAAVIRIAISEAAFEAIARTLPFGSVSFENQTNENGERRSGSSRAWSIG
jgi:hypothetical protein